MTPNVVELEIWLYIALEILLNSYPEEISGVHISSDMWRYFHLLGVDEYRTMVKVLKEDLQYKYVSDGCKGFVHVCFSPRAFVSGIETPNGVHATRNNEEVPDNDKKIYGKSICDGKII